MKIFAWPSLLMFIALFSAPLAAQTVGRIEVHPIPSVTLSTAQFLTVQREGKPVTLAGELRLPPGAPGTRFPAFVVIHGSSGIGGNINRWMSELNAIGVAVFVVDSFSARGIENTVADQSQLDHLSMLHDAYRALDLLAQHRRIDPNRIGILGFSKGGVAALYAAMDRFNATWGSNKARFAAYLAFYPPCYRYRDDEKVDAKPIRILHGEADDYVPIAPCRDYVARLAARGTDAKLFGYENAYHGFDAEVLPERFSLPMAQQVAKCRLGEGEAGTLLNLETGKPLARTDACIGIGATVGYHKAAHQKALEDVRQIVKAAFKLN